MFCVTVRTGYRKDKVCHKDHGVHFSRRVGVDPGRGKDKRRGKFRSNTSFSS